jgi:DNA modification methylase
MKTKDQPPATSIVRRLVPLRGGGNPHPTVKPLELMQYLCKLVKQPERNLVLDPFVGSGSTLLACQMLGIPCIGIELSEDYCEIAAKRLRG